MCVFADWPSGRHSLLPLSSCSSILSREDNTQTRACKCVLVCVSFQTIQGAHPAAMKAKIIRWPVYTHADSTLQVFSSSALHTIFVQTEKATKVYEGQSCLCGGKVTFCVCHCLLFYLVIDILKVDLNFMF